MKHIFSLGVVLLFCLFGEIVKAVLPFPIPASIYGMVLLFISLELKIIKLEQISNVAHYFISIMLIFFIMPAVSIMDSFSLIKNHVFEILIAIIIPTILVVIVTGLVTQKVEKLSMRHQKKEGEMVHENNN